MKRLGLGKLLVIGALVAGSIGPVRADGTPQESCAKLAGLVADNKLSEVPAAIREASKGAIDLEDGAFRNLQPIIDSGTVKVNAFLTEKNYNDTLLKIWRLMYFDWDSLYLRCTYLKVDGQWVMIHVGYESEEEEIELP